MGTRIGKEKIAREPGYLYFIGKDGFVWKSPTAVNKSGKKAKIGTEKISKRSGYMYYLDKDGYVAEAQMKRKQ